MSQDFNRNLRLATGLCQELKDLANTGASQCNDDSCSTMWGQLAADMDKYLGLIDKEIEGHKSKSKWD